MESNGERPDERPKKSKNSDVGTRRFASRQRHRPLSLSTFNIYRLQRLSEQFWGLHEQLTHELLASQTEVNR